MNLMEMAGVKEDDLKHAVGHVKSSKAFAVRLSAAHSRPCNVLTCSSRPLTKWRSSTSMSRL